MNRSSESVKPLLKVEEIEIRAVAHATENLEKVKQAVGTILPETQPPVEFTVTQTRGYYGNPIRVVVVKLSRPLDLNPLFHSLVSHLAENTRTRIQGTLGERVDKKGSLYLRFDKQDGLQGSLQLRDDDPIHVRIRFRKKAKTGSLTEELAHYLSPS